MLMRMVGSACTGGCRRVGSEVGGRVGRRRRVVNHKPSNQTGLLLPSGEGHESRVGECRTRVQKLGRCLREEAERVVGGIQQRLVTGTQQERE